jgi:hypothetical protein
MHTNIHLSVSVIPWLSVNLRDKVVVEVEVEVNLRPTVDPRPIVLSHEISFRQLRIC